jgi:hypothetical protein
MFTKAALLFAALPAAYAHIGIQIASGYTSGDGYKHVEPLANLPFNQWWFHGMMNNAPKGAPLALPTGGAAVVELSCNRQYSKLGGGSGDNPCPSDTPSMHAGNPVRPADLTGCGLAIAYKSDIKQVQPEDFVIFSVNTQCVQNLRTSFQVPKAMPPCPNGKCICAWFWQGKHSANEMYMNGFDCNVTGGSASAKIGTPKKSVFCKGNPGNCVKGPKLPQYWGNQAPPQSPNVMIQLSNNQKPEYNENWGFSNGAQNDITTGGAAGSTGGQTNTGSTPDESGSGKPTDNTGGSNTPVYSNTVKAVPTTFATRVASPTGSPSSGGSNDCAWPGHCLGATCKSYNDCSDSLTCTNGKCANK